MQCILFQSIQYIRISYKYIIFKGILYILYINRFIYCCCCCCCFCCGCCCCSTIQYPLCVSRLLQLPPAKQKKNRKLSPTAFSPIQKPHSISLYTVWQSASPIECKWCVVAAIIIFSVVAKKVMCGILLWCASLSLHSVRHFV